MNTNLSPLEKDAINAFTLRPEVKKILSSGGRLAVVYGPHTGIGVPVEVTAQSADGSVTLREDVTDVSCW